jgi:hypothetical protein
MDSTLLNNVKNIIAKSNSNTTSLNLEVIHVITWKDLKFDPTRSEVFFRVKKIFISVFLQIRHFMTQNRSTKYILEKYFVKVNVGDDVYRCC